MIGDIGIGPLGRDMLRTCEFDRGATLRHDVLDPVVAHPSLEVLYGTASAEDGDELVPAGL